MIEERVEICNHTYIFFFLARDRVAANFSVLNSRQVATITKQQQKYTMTSRKMEDSWLFSGHVKLTVFQLIPFRRAIPADLACFPTLTQEYLKI